MTKNMNFKNMIAKRNRTRKANKSKKSQKGGVGFKLEVGACPIGGRPPVVATSDCPAGVGPGSPNFANALYGGKRHSSKRGCGQKSKGNGCSTKSRNPSCKNRNTKSNRSRRTSRNC
jgi:hypothetical protein